MSKKEIIEQVYQLHLETGKIEIFDNMPKPEIYVYTKAPDMVAAMDKFINEAKRLKKQVNE